MNIVGIFPEENGNFGNIDKDTIFVEQQIVLAIHEKNEISHMHLWYKLHITSSCGETPQKPMHIYRTYLCALSMRLEPE